MTNSEYPPKPLNAFIAKILGYVQWGIMILMFAGDWIFAKFGIVPP